jgi:hypothetical protein
MKRYAWRLDAHERVEVGHSTVVHAEGSTAAAASQNTPRFSPVAPTLLPDTDF